MKTKMILLVLSATVLLGACSEGKREQHSPRVVHSQSSYEVTGDRLTRADVRKVQATLADQGYYRGAIDGIWGPQTSQAILAYQLSHDQRQTGTLTVDNLHEFGVQMDRDAYWARRN